LSLTELMKKRPNQTISTTRGAVRFRAIHPHPTLRPRPPRAGELNSFGRMKSRGSYVGFVPPCGVYCGACPVFVRAKNPCAGAETHCRERRCKGIYVCCVERKGLRYCHQCGTYPCSRFKRFAASWQRCGQDLMKNQTLLARTDESRWLAHMSDLYKGGEKQNGVQPSV
jgi:hypothetical protein